MNKKYICLFILSIIGCAGRQPQDLGVKAGKFKKCPEKPNCVCSQADDEKHMISPIEYNSLKSDAYEKILKIIKSLKNTKIIERTDNYIRVEFTTKIMRFVDDVEFYFPEEKLIHVRSASRIGYSDMGLNRKRIENIRKIFSGGEKK